MDYSPPDSSVHGILQTKIQEWVAMPSSKDLPVIEPMSLMSSALAGRFFTTSATEEARSCGNIHNGKLLSHKKELIWVCSHEVDEPRAYYMEWSKSERER